MKVFISQYMGGRDTDIIKQEREPIEKMLKQKGYEILNSIIEYDIPEDTVSIPTWYVAKSLEIMSKADAVYFMKGWQQGSGCKIERQCAEEYCIKIFEQ